LFNGVLVTGLRIPSFIVTLGSYNLIYGVSLWITKTSTFNPVYPPPGWKFRPRSSISSPTLTASFGTHPISLEVVWMLGLALVVGFLLHRTLFGFRLMAIGGNPVAAQARPPSGDPLQDPRLRHLGMLAAPREFSIFRSSRRAAEHRPLLYLPGFRGGDHRRRQPFGRQGDGNRRDERGALLLAELQQGLALLTPGPHVQQLFLGFVTIGAVALDLRSPISASAGRHERRTSASALRACINATARLSRWPVSISISGQARCWGSPDRTAPAKARWCALSRAKSAPTAAN
jgi:hypothetical protein